MPRGKKTKAKAASREKLIDTMRREHVKRARDRDKAVVKNVDDVKKMMAKQFGAGSVVTIANQTRAANTRAIPSGWQPLDDILTGETDAKGRSVAGTGIGWPRGRVIEVFGPPDSGKTTTTLELIIAAQKAGLVCSFIDAEHALDLKYATDLGVDLNTLLLTQPDSAEQALEIIRAQIRSKKVDVIVLDSVAAIEPEVEQEKKVGDTVVAAQARIVSRALRSFVGIAAKNNVLLVCVNQLRTKIGVRFGNPETTPAGSALKFYASVRLDVRLVKSFNKNGKKVGQRTRIKAVKNKAAPPFREVFVDIYPSKGFTEVYGDPDIGGDDDDATGDDE